MAFQVDVTDPALADAEEYFQYVRDVNKESAAADRWFRGLVAAIYSLEEFPTRCARIPDAADFDEDIRHLIYYSHRIIFGIDGEKRRVVVYRVFHGARKGLRREDVAIEC